MKQLVIVESPNKIKSIEKYLGKEFIVQASVGHIVYLPSSGFQDLGVDIETWTPRYRISPDKKKVVQTLKKAAKQASVVYIATDPDREGEAIADNLVTFLEIENKYHRIRFNEITDQAVNEAMQHPTKVDDLLVKSQVARRILDRIIGFKLSKLMRNKITSAPISPSAGRVQSIALKLVIEREAEINAFIPVKYFTLSAIINEKKQITAEYVNPKKEENRSWIDVSEINNIQKLLTKKMVVSEIKVTQKNDAKAIPLKQATLYKRADSSLGMSAKSTQRAAQRLYEGYGDGGLISYPRTDSTRLSETFIKAGQKYILSTLGQEYLISEINGVAGAQDAHEAIRPTNLSLTPEQAKTKFNLESSEAKLYELIWLHTMQCLVTPARREFTRYKLVDNGHIFTTTTSRILFDGFSRLSKQEETKKTFSFKEGETIEVEKYNFEEHQTQPPARYNDGSLIEKLDEIGVGRPSTFATTVNILSERKYVKKEGKALSPTEFGEIVYEKLEQSFPDIMNIQYTAKVEKELDEIANGSYKYENVLDDFWKVFEKDVITATQELEITKIIPILANKKCPLCGSELVIRHNRKTGASFYGCSTYPNCRHMEPDPNYKPKFRPKFKKSEPKSA